MVPIQFTRCNRAGQTPCNEKDTVYFWDRLRQRDMELLGGLLGATKSHASNPDLKSTAGPGPCLRTGHIFQSAVEPILWLGLVLGLPGNPMSIGGVCLRIN